MRLEPRRHPPLQRIRTFEYLEAEGHRLLPEQLKAMLKALARSNLLRVTLGEFCLTGTATRGRNCLTGVKASCRERLAHCRILPQSR